MPWHFTMWDRVRSLLELQDLEVHTLTLVRQYEVGIQGTTGPTSLLRVALPWELIPFQTRLDVQVRDSSATRSALNRDAGRLGLDTGGSHYYTRNFNQAGHLIALKITDVGASLVTSQSDMDILDLIALAPWTRYLGTNLYDAPLTLFVLKSELSAQ